MKDLDGVYYIQNLKYGYIFAADSDKDENDHIVEACPTSDNIKYDKYKFKITKQPGDYYTIANVKYGTMFTADNKKDENDHYVEAGDVGDTAKSQWRIGYIYNEYPAIGMYIQNVKYNYMFVADKTTKGSDHVVETSPNSGKDQLKFDKYRWRIVPIDMVE